MLIPGVYFSTFIVGIEFGFGGLTYESIPELSNWSFVFINFYLLIIRTGNLPHNPRRNCEVQGVPCLSWWPSPSPHSSTSAASWPKTQRTPWRSRPLGSSQSKTRWSGTTVKRCCSGSLRYWWSAGSRSKRSWWRSAASRTIWKFLPYRE